MALSQISRQGRGQNLPQKRDVSAKNADEEKGLPMLKSTFDLLERGEKEIELDDKRRDAILILGNPGSGKSIFTKWLAGDDTKLISKETQGGEYIIEDHDRIDDATVKSEKIFPELVIDAKTDSAYYDCPGFSDTQGLSREIAETYFIKKVVDYSKSVKMVFVISHSSLRRGMDRHDDFMKLVRHVTDFVKDIEKFRNSIALVATKVGTHSEPDVEVIAEIAGFLQEVKTAFEDGSKGPNLSEKQKRFHANAIKFVEVLLEKEGENYLRIGIFRSPDKAGPVSDIPVLQKGKKDVETILLEKLNFTPKNNEDFDYTISEKTKNAINDVIEEINNNLWDSLTNIAAKTERHYRNMVESVRDKIRLLVSEPDFVDVNSSDAEVFRHKFDIGKTVTSDLMIKLKNLIDTQEQAVIVNNALSNLDIDIPKPEIELIAKQGKYFTFLQTVSDKKLVSHPWYHFFERLEILFDHSNTDISQDVKPAAHDIINRLQTSLNDAVTALQEKYTEHMKSLDMQKLPEKLKRDSRIILEITEEIKNGTTPDKLMNNIHYIAEDLGVSLPINYLQNVGILGNYLRFLEIISTETLVAETMTWSSPFENIVKYFDESEKWYTFLEDLNNKLSEYAIQKDRQRYYLDYLDGRSLSSNNFEKFLIKIESLNVTEYQSVKNQAATYLRREELNQVLGLTLMHTQTVTCSEPYIIVKGSFISLNETMHNLISNSDTNGRCNNFESQLSAGKYNLFKVFALNKVFIDTDLMFSGKGIAVAIIAPDWEVVGSRRIELNGADAPRHESISAKKGPHPGNNGENGAPGNPGLPGESFFGIGGTFAIKENLRIFSNGGTGGSGQVGGQGAIGVNGTDAPKPSKDDPSCKNGRFQGFRCTKGEDFKEESFWKMQKIYGSVYFIRGGMGGRGGRGGDGGKGGNGGNPGKTTLLQLSKPSFIMKFNLKGKKGGIANGGFGGKGGFNGKDQKAKFRRIYPQKVQVVVDFDDDSKTEWEWIETLESKETGYSGLNGLSGRNDKGIKDPVPAKGISGLPYIINDYKIYQRENMKERFQKFSILSFLDLLNSNNEVRELYDVLALSNEFQGLEEQFPILGDQIDFSPFYSSLLERISAFAKVRKDIQNENKKVLNYLYTATLGKIYSLRKESENILIIDMKAYLEMVKDNIKTLKDLQVINNKVDVINKYKENYKSGIDKKIQEAQSLIEKEINPEMENINAKIDDQINSLIAETILLEAESETEWEKLNEKRKRLEKDMVVKGWFRCLKLLGEGASLLGPYGQIAGTLLNGIGTVAEPLVLEKQKESLEIPSGVSSSLKTLSENIEAMRKSKIEHLEKLLKNVDEQIEKNPTKLSDMTDKIKDIREKLNKVSAKESDFSQVSVLEKELEDNIKRKGAELKNDTGDQVSLDATEALEKISEVIKLSSSFTEIYSKYKEDKDEIDVVTKSMKNIEEEIKMLKDYERSIYDTMVPMLQNMEGELKDVSETLGTKSHVALDVKKWQVQNYLKDMKLQMQKLTKGREISDDLSRSIEKLDGVMTTLIKVYDRIQTYQDQQNLANYIADISSVAANTINIQDQTLANAVNRLEFAIRANLVLEQYKSAIEALKQWVFPFADQYIEKSMLPSQLQLDKNIENLVQNAMRQIETIQQKLALYPASIMEDDQYLKCEEFTSRYVSSKPFYVWKNEENRRSISSLLSGKKVVLKADVKESHPKKDAIKFSEIEFDFKIKNETAQPLLTEILKGFDIYATHLGNSYYRYDGQISLITSNSILLSYSYEKNDDGIPIRSNEPYNRLRLGNLLLSPYTFWELSITKETNKYTFQDLEKYKNEINVELSGLGSYVLRRPIGFAENLYFTFENNTMESNAFENNTMIAHTGTGLRECKRSKYRSARSVNGIAVDFDFMTNDASKGISSPMISLYNFLKTYFATNLVMSINLAFFGEQTSVRRDGSELKEECTEIRNMGPTVVSNPTVTDTDATSVENDCIKERIEQKSDTIFDVDLNDNNSCFKSSLLSDQKYENNNHSTQFPDLNCSLLLADLVTRTITRNKYKSPIEEYLLSPREVMLGRISDGVVRNENDVKQMLQRHLSEKEVEKPSSWFSKLNSYAKSMLQVLGLVGNSDTDVYVQDLRHLFA